MPETRPQPPNVDRIMRWLKANGVQHEADQILDGSIHVTDTTIEYEVFVPPHGRHRLQVPHIKHWSEVP